MIEMYIGDTLRTGSEEPRLLFSCREREHLYHV